MVTLLWRSDVHLSDQTPQSRTDDWAQTVLGKLKQVGNMASREGAHAVIDGGDFFNIKSPSRNSHRLIRQVADIHKQYSCPVFANVGNHDCVFGDISFLGQQPLGVLFSSGVFERAYSQYEVYFGPQVPNSTAISAFRFDRAGGGWLDGNPFSNRQEANKQIPIVRVVGVPYQGTKYDLGWIGIDKGPEDYLVVAAHLLASPKGGQMFEGEDIIKYDDLKGFGADVFMFGHWHKNQGVEQVGGKWIVNIGSLTRGSISQDDVGREPSVAVLRFDKDTVTIKCIPLRVGPPEVVFNLENRKRQEKRKMQMAGFIASIQEALVAPTGPSLREVVMLAPVDPVVRERALLYMERHEID